MLQETSLVIVASILSGFFGINAQKLGKECSLCEIHMCPINLFFRKMELCHFPARKILSISSNHFQPVELNIYIQYLSIVLIYIYLTTSKVELSHVFIGQLYFFFNESPVRVFFPLWSECALFSSECVRIFRKYLSDIKKSIAFFFNPLRCVILLCE